MTSLTWCMDQQIFMSHMSISLATKRLFSFMILSPIFIISKLMFRGILTITSIINSKLDTWMISLLISRRKNCLESLKISQLAIPIEPQILTQILLTCFCLLLLEISSLTKNFHLKEIALKISKWKWVKYRMIRLRLW